MSTTAACAPAHRRRRRSRRARARSRAALEDRSVAMPHRERQGHRPARADVVLWQLAAAAASCRSPPRRCSRTRPVSPDRKTPAAPRPAKCNGSAVFGIDVAVPGMLNAVKTARSFTGQVGDQRGRHPQDAGRARGGEDRGARHRQRRPRLAAPARSCRVRNAVCVVADQFWQAQRALAALEVEFDGGASGDLSAKIDAMLNAALDAEHGVTALVKGGRGRSCRSAPPR